MHVVHKHQKHPACAVPVLGVCLAGGQYQGRIRSLCQFYNSTDLVLEVALLQDEDTAWTMLPTTASQSSRSSSQANVGEVTEEEVFEYERYLPLRGWSPNHLSALDPRQFSRFRNGSNGTSSFPRVPLPQVSLKTLGRLTSACGPVL
jgi:vacuolar protein sorting-associated protein 13A/C